MIVDADAHVVETEHTWDFLDASEKKFRPQLFSSVTTPTCSTGSSRENRSGSSADIHSDGN